MLIATAFPPYHPVSAESDEDSFIFEVIAVKKNAWVTRVDNSVKSSLRVGDVLYRGDRLDVMRGNSVQMALDKERLNVITLTGSTVIEIAKDARKTIDLDHGQIFALLDNQQTDRRFKIRSPLAVASVRGTQYQIHHAENTQVMTYSGQVRVSGRNALGHEKGPSVTLGPNTKTRLSDQAPTPSAPESLSEKELREIQEVRRLVEDTREWLEDWHVASRFDELSNEESERMIEKTLNSIDDEENVRETAADKIDGLLIY